MSVSREMPYSAQKMINSINVLVFCVLAFAHDLLDTVFPPW